MISTHEQLSREMGVSEFLTRHEIEGFELHHEMRGFSIAGRDPGFLDKAEFEVIHSNGREIRGL